MNTYNSGAAFRRALEERLRVRSLTSGSPLARLRKTVAFDRFLARLVQYEPNRWVLKGGYAIQLRIIEKARTTKDIDLLAIAEYPELLVLLRAACKHDLGDWFQFEVNQTGDPIANEFGGNRFSVHSMLDGRRFEDFHLDIGTGDRIIDPIDYLAGTPLLDFAGIQPALIPCYPINQQIAEKVHAYTRPRASGESSRVKDFVDILLLAELDEIDASRLKEAIHATFRTRRTHRLPQEMPDPPAAWVKTFLKLAEEVTLNYQTLEEANIFFKRFLDPILSNRTLRKWHPYRWDWE